MSAIYIRAAAIALNYFAYNFLKIHHTLPRNGGWRDGSTLGSLRPRSPLGVLRAGGGKSGVKEGTGMRHDYNDRFRLIVKEFGRKIVLELNRGKAKLSEDGKTVTITYRDSPARKPK